MNLFRCNYGGGQKIERTLLKDGNGTNTIQCGEYKIIVAFVVAHFGNPGCKLTYSGMNMLGGGSDGGYYSTTYLGELRTWEVTDKNATLKYYYSNGTPKCLLVYGFK